MMEEFKAAKMLTKSIRSIMCEHWDSNYTCSGNVQLLMEKCNSLDKQIKSLEIKTNEEKIMPTPMKNGYPKKTRADSKKKKSTKLTSKKPKRKSKTA